MIHLNPANTLLAQGVDLKKMIKMKNFAQIAVGAANKKVIVVIRRSFTKRFYKLKRDKNMQIKEIIQANKKISNIYNQCTVPYRESLLESDFNFVINSASVSESESESSSVLINIDICIFLILYLHSFK